MDDSTPTRAEILAEALAVRDAHHAPAAGAPLWPRCDQCGPESCPALTAAVTTLAGIRDQLASVSARPDNPLFAHLFDWPDPGGTAP